MSDKRNRGKDTYGYSRVIREELRHTHDGPEVPPHRKAGGKKNKPCKKSPDKLHSYVAHTETYSFMDWTYTYYICEHCGKRR